MQVLRGGEFKSVPAAELVPGDIIRIRIGDVVPADVKVRGRNRGIARTALDPPLIWPHRLALGPNAVTQLLEGDPLKIDQAALTGESLPVTKVAGDEAFSGSVVKQGEIEAVVHATGRARAWGMPSTKNRHG